MAKRVDSVAGFSFLVLAAYSVLGRESTGDLRTAGITLALFVVGVVLSLRRSVAIAVSFLLQQYAGSCRVA
jgi:hypothetical protein